MQGRQPHGICRSLGIVLRSIAGEATPGRGIGTGDLRDESIEMQVAAHCRVYAGGDAVTGAATVILAMGAGKLGAKSIDEYLSNK